MLRFAIFVATGLLVGCPSRRPQAPRAGDDTALRVRVAQAEARRGGGIAELEQLVASADGHARELAVRGLGRIGGDRALALVEHALVDGEPRVVAAALLAIGVAASLDEPTPEQTSHADAIIAAAIDARAARGRSAAGQHAIELAGIEALGRAGSASAQPRLARAVASPDDEVAAAAAIALGRHGRRKLALDPAARAALVAATTRGDAAVRYAATYALSREHEPPADDTANAALAQRIADDWPETRATAIAALARRKAIGSAHAAIEGALRDRDWRVATEAVRALVGPDGDDAGRVAVAQALPRRFAELARGDAAAAHLLIEALRGLAAHPVADGRAITAVEQVTQAAQADTRIAPLARGWIHCLGLVAIVKLGFTDPRMPAVAPAAIDRLAACSDALPDHLRLPLLAEYLDAPVGDASTRRAVLRILVGHRDPRVRAAGLIALPKRWNDGDAAEQSTIVGTVTSAMAVKDPIVAGTAVDVADTLYDTIAAGHPTRATLDAAVLARAKAETDIELASALYALIGKRTIAGGADVCRAGLAGAPARAKAAADCLRALGEAGPARPPGATEPPAVDVAAVIGRRLYWHLVTSHGEILIELRPDVAPWAVASIVALTRRGFYDGLEVHRVVPDFVVQGGDPTESGWGGPGYTLPAEPASGRDGVGFAAGGVGIADAGRDSGGSQWFIMHARAPHLDGRYTWIGSVASGGKSADALLIGDRVERATIVNR